MIRLLRGIAFVCVVAGCLARCGSIGTVQGDTAPVSKPFLTHKLPPGVSDSLIGHRIGYDLFRVDKMEVAPQLVAHKTVELRTQNWRHTRACYCEFQNGTLAHYEIAPQFAGSERGWGTSFAAWSADGTKALLRFFNYEPIADGNILEQSVLLADLPTGTVTNLTDGLGPRRFDAPHCFIPGHGGRDDRIAWGKREVPGMPELWTMNLDGSDKRPLFEPIEGNADSLQWMQHNDIFAYRSRNDRVRVRGPGSRENGLVRNALEWSATGRVTPQSLFGGEASPAFSGDGKWLVYVARSIRRSEGRPDAVGHELRKLNIETMVDGDMVALTHRLPIPLNDVAPFDVLLPDPPVTSGDWAYYVQWNGLALDIYRKRITDGVEQCVTNSPSDVAITRHAAETDPTTELRTGLTNYPQPSDPLLDAWLPRNDRSNVVGIWNCYPVPSADSQWLAFMSNRRGNRVEGHSRDLYIVPTGAGADPIAITEVVSSLNEPNARYGVRPVQWWSANR